MYAWQTIKNVACVNICAPCFGKSRLVVLGLFRRSVFMEQMFWDWPNMAAPWAPESSLCVCVCVFVWDARHCDKMLIPLPIVAAATDPTVLRTSGSTSCTQANMRAWRCTTVQNAPLGPTLPWSSATTWRNTTPILRIQIWLTYTQVKRFFKFCQ